MSACNHSRLIQLGGDPRADPRAHCWYYSLDDPGGAKGEQVYFSKSATTVTQTWISSGKEMENEINWCNCGNHHRWELKPITPVNHAKKAPENTFFFLTFFTFIKVMGTRKKKHCQNPQSRAEQPQETYLNGFWHYCSRSSIQSNITSFIYLLIMITKGWKEPLGS